MPRFLLPALVLLAGALTAAEPAAPVKPGVRSRIRFEGSTPQSSPAQFRLRLRAADAPPAYDLAREQFEILVPRGYKAGVPHGLFLWISPGDRPTLPAGWDAVLAEKKLIFIGALGAGNNRETPDRIRLAVDANHHLRQLYDIDPDRVYVSGHSGGGRVASMVGVAYADMFTGAACFMGVNFYRPAEGKDGTLYEARYLPHPEIAGIARQQNRFALVTGDQDFNLDNTRALFEQGFQAEKFQGAKLFVIPNQGHGAPAAAWLAKAIDFLDRGQ